MVGSGPVSRGDPGGGPYRGVWRKLPPGRSVSRNGGAGVSGWLPRGLGSGLGAGGAHRPDGGAARSSSSSAGGGVPRSGGTKSIGGRERTGGLGGVGGSGFSVGGSKSVSSGPVQPSSRRNASSRSVTADLLSYQTTRMSATLQYQPRPALLHRIGRPGSAATRQQTSCKGHGRQRTPGREPRYGNTWRGAGVGARGTDGFVGEYGPRPAQAHIAFARTRVSSGKGRAEARCGIAGRACRAPRHGGQLRAGGCLSAGTL